MFIRHIPNLKNAKVTVMGLGLFGGGVGVTRYLARKGATVTVTDTKTANELSESITQLKDLPITFNLGGHNEEDFTNSDLIIVNPAIPSDSPYLNLAIKNSIPLETEMNLFMKLCKARTIGITGSNGKTTTTALIGEILNKSPIKTWTGGNIGKSLLEYVDEIKQDDIVVLELSSFQLENLSHIQVSPTIAVVTNITPNHLDRHKTMDNYINAKKSILRYQRNDDCAILNWDDTIVRHFTSHTKGKILFFSIKEKLVNGAFSSGEKIQFSSDNYPQEINIAGRKLLGQFNIQNMLAATAAVFASAGNIWRDWHKDAERVFNEFTGVEHRLEFVCNIKGVKYYNDSIATNPESTIVALDTLPSPIILIAGGYDKKLAFDKLADKIAEKVKYLILIGQTANIIKDLVKKREQNISIDIASSLKDAVYLAKNKATRGDTILLSPACASYDMFRNFAERGNIFKKIALEELI